MEQKTEQSTKLYSIGYGNRKMEDFIELIKKFQAPYLVDIRTKPYSKFNPDFSKEKLKAILSRNKIQYVFMGDELGGQPNDRSCYEGGFVDYKKIEEKDFFLNAINRLKVAWDKDIKIVIMCSEKKPQECHRSKLLGVYLEKIGLSLNHIDENDNLITQEKVLRKLNNGQFSLFEETFQSRKKYQVNS